MKKAASCYSLRKYELVQYSAERIGIPAQQLSDELALLQLVQLSRPCGNGLP
jgi:hypothetical protein